jgi:hypothetical protein
MRRASILAVPPLLALLGGCQLLIGLTGGEPASSTTTASGGGGTTSSSGTSSTSSTGGHGGTSSTTSSAGGGGHTGGTSSTTSSTGCAGQTCGMPGECPAPPECAERTCDAGCCGTKPAALGTTCTTGGKVCGDPAGAKAGVCVECNGAAECGSKVCTGNVCQPPSCTDGVKNGSEIAVDCGGGCGPCKGTVLLAGGPSGTLAAVLDRAGTWAPTPFAQGTTHLPSVAFLPTVNQAVGLVMDDADGLAHFTVWDGAAWSAFAAVSPFLTPTTTPAFDGKLRGASAMVGVSDTAHVILWDSLFHYWYQSYSAGTWAAPVPLAVSTAPLCSAYSARLANLAGVPKAAFVDGTCTSSLTTNHAYAMDVVAGVGQGAQDVSAGTLPYVDIATFPDAPPTLIALTGGTADLMMAYLRCPTSGCTTLQVFWSVRNTGSGTWSTPAQVPNGVVTADPVALAPLPAGGAMLAFRGTDGKLYAMTYSAATGWGTTAPTNLAAASTTPSPPALAKSVGTADVELAFIDAADGSARHMRYTAGTWTAPTAIGAATGLTRVALASGP